MRPFRFLGLDGEGRPVLLRVAAAEAVPVAAGPRYLHPRWQKLLGRSAADVEAEARDLELAEAAGAAVQWAEHQAERAGWSR